MKREKIIIHIKWFIILVIVVKIGSWITSILEKTDVNVWIARTIRYSICVVIGLLISYKWLGKEIK